MSGPCRSPSGGERALTPPSRHSLGRPLPCQQADSPQASPHPDLIAQILYPSIALGDHQGLVRLSADYTCDGGVFLRVTAPFATSQHPALEARNPKSEAQNKF